MAQLQCDKMARLFFHYLAIDKALILPNSIKMRQSVLFFKIWNKATQKDLKSAKVAKFGRIWSHWH